MKRILISVAAGLIMLSSCSEDEPSQDDPTGNTGGDGGGSSSGTGGSSSGTGGDGGTGGTIDPCAPETNGWPHNALPEGYLNGSGFNVGARVPAFDDGEDQNGAKDVHLGQFYGSMVMMSFGGVWCQPCNDAASSAQDLMDDINSSQSDYQFWAIEVLVDDATPGGDFADLADGQAWASTYGLEFPVLTGQPAYDLGNDFQVYALPTYVILDPELKVREIIEGYPEDAALSAAVDNAFDAFIAENPSWTFDCNPPAIAAGCGNAIIESGESCDGGVSLIRL